MFGIHPDCTINALHSIIKLTLNGVFRHYVTIWTARIFFKKANIQVGIISFPVETLHIQVEISSICETSQFVALTTLSAIVSGLSRWQHTFCLEMSQGWVENDVYCQHSVMLTSYLPTFFQFFSPKLQDKTWLWSYDYATIGSWHVCPTSLTPTKTAIFCRQYHVLK